MRVRLRHIYRLRHEDERQRRDRLDIDHKWDCVAVGCDGRDNDEMRCGSVHE